MGINTKPIKVTTVAPNFTLKGKKLKESFNVFLKKTHEEISIMAKEEMKVAIVLTDSVATQTLLNSVYRRLLVGKSGDAFTTNIGFQKPASSYAFFANYGRTEGDMPPVAPILKWMQARGIPENFLWAIRKKIGSEGTKPKLFVERADKNIKKNADIMLNRRLEEFKRTIK